MRSLTVLLALVLFGIGSAGAHEGYARRVWGYSLIVPQGGGKLWETPVVEYRCFKR